VLSAEVKIRAFFVFFHRWTLLMSSFYKKKKLRHGDTP
jgi:hypothetical protein